MKKNKGITLISLAVTIIVLLILAGITLTLVIGENGLITRAQQAGKDYGQAENNEMADLNALNEQLADYYAGEESSLPENKEDTEAGTIVKLPETWATGTMRYVQTSNGAEVTNSTKVATVYAVATGAGEQVPVPYGFYYVGGNKENGVVISDNETDKNKYIGQTNIGKDLQGNQFVFIPCTLAEYTKISWGYTNSSGWDTSTQSSEKTQIQKYGGFYVGRYEAGTSSAKFNTDINAAVTASSWQNACYTSANSTSDSKPTTKSGEIPWFHSDYATAVTMSERMYNTNYVNSGLITGTQWDVMINWMSTVSDKSDLKANCIWGNYNNTPLTDCEGKYATVDSNGSSSAWVENTGKTNRVSTYTLLSTGASETAKKKNLYDVAGNLWEWTQETAYYSSGTNYFMLRGGSFNNAYASNPACYRNYNTASYPNTAYGFRPVLYMK